MITMTIRTAKRAIPLLATVVLLSACKDGSDNKTDAHQADEFDISSTGRLVVTAAESSELAILNSTDGSLIERFSLDNPASGLYASPQSRFALVAQRDQNQVQVLDGGLYQEDHGDHLHPYEKNPSMLAQTLDGVRPTHHRNNESRSAFFFDGEGDQGLMASIADFDDDEILNNNVRSLELSNAMHGVAEPRGDFLISTYRAPDASHAVLPDQVELYKFNSNSGGYEFVERFEELCPLLHGGFSTEDASIFGCSDGVLVVHQDGDQFSTTKIDNPAGMAEGARIGGFSGFSDSNLVAGWARGELYAVTLDPDNHENDKMEFVDWRDGTDIGAEAEYSTAKMDDEGEILMVLNKSGGLHLLDAQDNFKHLIEIKVLSALPEFEGHGHVSITSSKSGEDVYITDAINNQIVVVNLEHQEIEEPISLPFTPKHVAWVGIAGEGHDHEHEH
ncbi:MAG: hypothetical protein JKY50_01420 [Oleispira sp.]|nr:hypothetical protein [Oleispira sp.]MBL4879971.1 hypothetical protein [Oleispira sp.]